MAPEVSLFLHLPLLKPRSTFVPYFREAATEEGEVYKVGRVQLLSLQVELVVGWGRGGTMRDCVIQENIASEASVCHSNEDVKMTYN